MKILIIPEDFRIDQYILKPLFKKLFIEFGKPQANVKICLNPLLGGVEQALKSHRISDIISQYRMIDVFILCVDRDGKQNRRQRLDEIETEISTLLRPGKQAFVAADAWEELETWLLAGLNLPSDWSWRTIRADISVKEHYFEPLAAQRNLQDSPGGGREILGEEAARNIAAIRAKCPEDFDALAKRLDALLSRM